MIDKSNSKKNTKKRIKSEIVDSSRNSSAFFLQKYEIVIMLLGAGIISVLIIFVFLKPSGDSNLLRTKNNTEPVTVEDFQEQIDRLANMVEKTGLKDNEKLKSSIDKTEPKNKSSDISYADHEKRIERIEASLSIKYETLASRINRLERSIDKLSRKIDSYKKISSTKVVKPPLVKTSKKSETKKAVTKKKESIFHTVKKGDTLYSLSKQYGTSVSDLEKINHLPKNANIYPGDNLLVK
ncbi:MAG: LysM peptidoglycan-binding domain-containing protein [Desulfobacteraceae bacterium]|nr:LysM peptidoglycan-binding domain-containing protein [Desulfobacteraceae bacterium]